MKGKILTLLVVLSFPLMAHAQDQAMIDKINSLHGVLDGLYKDMMPLCSGLTGIGRSIGGFAALWYIAARIWRHLANAEPIDFYPLFRPFCIGLCIGLFPMVLAVIDGIMEPTVTGTAALVKGTNQAIAVLLKQKEAAIMKTDNWKMYVGITGAGDRDRWLRYEQGIGQDEPLPSEGIMDRLGNNLKFALSKASYNFRNSIKEWVSEVLQLLFQAAALCINTLRTFQRIVLAILGPIVFGLAVFDGMQQSLASWLTRYINVFLWLPVCNIFGAIIGKIQEKMLALDLSQIATTGDTFFSVNDTVYIIFMIIAIVGYTTVPSVANFIVNAGGAGAMLQKITGMASSTGKMVASGGSAMMKRAGSGAYNMANAGRHVGQGYSGQQSGAGMTGAIGRSLGHMGSRLNAGKKDRDNK
jgi:conjugative transposon TraJ protein